MSSRLKISSAVPVRNHFALKPLAKCVRVAITGGLLVGNVSAVRAELPIPVPGAWVSSGSAEFGNPVDPNTMEIIQHSDKAVLNWQQFNVGKENTVKFEQPGSSSVALNRIFQQNPSQILGHITANGQVYLVNPNGIVFGKDAVVDTHALVASTLNISDEVFQRGIIREFEKDTSAGQAALNGQTGDSATQVNPNSEIKVEAGASIHVDQNGQIILAAPKVTNAGSIKGDEKSQIILVASKDKVYLQPASSDSPFAGLLVEVGSGGKVENATSGEISVRQGNVTMAGFAVNQSGRVNATTSVNVNGSIRLLAREQATDDVFNGVHKLRANATERGSDVNDGLGIDSKVTFGSGSVTEIQADNNGETAFGDQAQKQSYVEVSAKQINMETDAVIEAPSGKVDFTATDNLVDPLLGNAGRINMADGSKIDVSGKKNVQVAMERNVAEVFVQTYNLRDAPNQKGGVLQGAKVNVDIRKDTKILDASGGAAAIKSDINERLTEGGEINFVSSGDVIINDNAVADISGGYLSYQDGYINTTKLIDEAGRIVDISDADPERRYVGIYGVVTEQHSKWGGGQTMTWNMQGAQPGRFEHGYIEGKTAGSFNIQSPLTAGIGHLIAGSQSGFYQRDKPVAGGSFTINQADNTGSRTNLFLSSQNVLFQTQSPSVNVAFDQAFPDDGVGHAANLILSTEAIKSSGISKLVVKTGGSETIVGSASVELPAKAELTLDAASIDVNGSVYTPGGAINLHTVGNLNLHDGSTLDASGRWVNDYRGNGQDILVTDGGSVTVKADQNLDFSSGAVIEADGGAWLNSSGRTLTAGKGGDIKLSAGTATVSGEAIIEGRLSAYGLNEGGSLTLASNTINVGTSNNNANGLFLHVNDKGAFDIASQLGFSQLDLVSSQGNITVKSGANLSLVTQNRLLNSDYRAQASGKSIAGFSQVTTLAEHLRNPVALGLNGAGGVVIETASRISLDKGSSFDIQSSVLGRGVYIDGTLQSRGGSLDILLRSDTNDVAYDANQSIWLGEHSVLDLHGDTRLNPLDSLGRMTGEVLAGGDVTIKAQRGYVVMEQGSSVNVSGAGAVLELPTVNVGGGVNFAKQQVGSDAGQISITAAEGIILDGDFSAKGGASTNRDGKLEMALSRQFRNEPPIEVFPGDPGVNQNNEALVINVVQQEQSTLPNGMHFGSANAFVGKATISSDKLAKAGFDDLQLSIAPAFSRASSAIGPSGTPLTPGSIKFVGNVDLALDNSIVLDAQTIAWAPDANQTIGTVKLNTGYLELGSSAFNTVSGSSVKGNGTLEVYSRWTQLTGAAMLTGFNQVDLNSAHDLRMVGVRLGSERGFTGHLKTAADLNLTASQVYPSTLTDYKIEVTDPAGKITVANSGYKDSTPLSGAGKLSLVAADIQQDGVLKAPLGTLELNATSHLSFGSQSVTSVSADGQLIPLGSIASNLWSYALGSNGNLVFNEAPSSLTLGEKHINVDAPQVMFEKGSVVDVSGGGDLVAAEFQPGLGGSHDYLDPSSKSYQGGFAVIPAVGNSLAPYDHNLSANSGYAPGSTVYLAGGSGLAAGYYTVLPAKYAILPGAYLVTPVSGTQDQLITRYATSGLPIVSGFLAQTGSGARDARTNGFLVESREQVLKRSEYDIQTASRFFTQRADVKNTSTPILPVDAGQVSINAISQLILEGAFKVGSANGRGAKMDIAAQHIEVVDQLNPNAVPGLLQILDDDLSNLRVDSLLLGGTRRFNNATGTTDLSVTADDVTIAQGSRLAMLDFVAAAKHNLTVESDTEISSSGTVNTGDIAVKVAGDGALLRVSADKQISLNRTGTDTPTTGNLIIDQGAILQASKSMLLDSSLSSVLNGDIVMDGGALSLTANSINLGETGLSQGNALNLSNDKLLSLSVDDLVLNSRGAINFLGNVGHFNADGGYDAIAFNNLTLDGAALLGFAMAGDVARITANNIEIKNSRDIVAGTAGTGSGDLQLTAKQFSQGAGALAVNGFSNVALSAAAGQGQTVASQYTATADGELKVAANLTLTADAVVALDGHKLKIDADSGNGYQVNILGNGDTGRTINSGLGGRLEVDAKAIQISDAAVVLPSGALTLQAGNGNIDISGQTKIDLAGRALNFADKVVYSQGGVFSADAKQGNVTLGQNTLLNIASGGGDAKGGKLMLTAQSGTVDLAGQLRANEGSATLDIADFAIGSNFDALMNQLVGAGINDTLYVRVRDADIVQATGNGIQAKQIDLVADRGNVDIGGQLVADGSLHGGKVSLSAGNKVVLQDGALISAKGGETGGKVSLSSVTSAEPAVGGIELKSGAVIDVAGADSASGGEVVFSALRTQNGVNIQPVAGNVLGYGSFDAEAVKRYTNADLGNDGAIDQADINAMVNDTAAYMANAVQIEAGLGGGIRLRPGIEIAYNGDLSLATAWELSAARYGQNADVVGKLTIRATDNLTMAHALSDGFNGGVLQSGDSWSMQLVAGADVTSADRLATTDHGNFVIGQNTSIHTGSGDIDVAAGGNITFADQTSTIYSAGRTDPANPRGTLEQSVSFDYLPNGEYPIGGGDLTMRAGAAIQGAVSTQFIDQWLYRQGYFDPGFEEGSLTAWTVDASQFQQNVGSFGGGRVDIAAAGNIDDLSVMLPTTGKQTGTDFTNNAVEVGGGGQMRVQAGGNISGGAFLLGKGIGEIVAGGHVKGSESTSQYAYAAGPQILLSGDPNHPDSGNSQLTVAAGSGVKLAGVSDAMLLSGTTANNPNNTHFFSYTAGDALNVQSLSGDVHLNENIDKIATALGITSGEEKRLLSIYPASLNVTAFNGNVQLDSDIVLYPSATSNMNIFAKQGFHSADGEMYTVLMSDADPALLPKAGNVISDFNLERITNLSNLFTASLINAGDSLVKSTMHAIRPVHLGDQEPIRVVTQQGDISSVLINLPKKAVIQAGRDLINTPMQIQQVNSDDASVVSAGRDLRFVPILDNDGNVDSSDKRIKIEVAGPGRALVKTGRDLDLGASVGLTTVGNLVNSNLGGTGASLDVIVGLQEGKPDYSAFINKYLVDSARYAAERNEAVSLIATFMRERGGNPNLSENDALLAFSELTVDQMIPVQAKLQAILSKVFFNELKLSGSASATDKSAGNEIGFAAIDTLFPNNQWSGDLSLFYSKIQTVAGGDINLMVPGGEVNAGLSVAPSGANVKKADELGVVVQGEGQINAFVKNDFIVNTSRVFTLGGGDILIWSSEGDIDAGKGAKSALSVVVDPPFFNEKDELVVPAPKITDGSGIRTAAALGKTPGDVFLLAPKGVVNAGEAGIAGTNVTISATAVLGANNIQVGGVGTGVPVASTGSLAAGLTGVGNLTSGVTQMAENSVGGDMTKGAANALAKAILGMLSVEVIGFGE